MKPPRRGLRARMRRPQRHRPGTAPGQLYQDPDAVATTIRAIGYGPDTLVEHEITDLEQLREVLGRFPVTWIDVVGLADVGLIEQLGKKFGLHPLALEDVTHLGQRAKVDDYDDHLFIVARMSDTAERGQSEQLALFLGHDAVLTFQERPGDNFEPVRERLRAGRPNLRGSGPDYLAYALLDAVIDGYFPALESYGEVLETLEDTILDEPGPELMAQIQNIKRELLATRRALWPHREMLNTLIRDQSEALSERTLVFIRDVYDSVIQAVEVVESYREVASGLVDLYLSSVSNKMNEVMKVLTIIATIFIPLGFLAGLYGMNFDPAASPWNMPELDWYWGYPALLGVMALVAGGMLFFFRRKGWL